MINALARLGYLCINFLQDLAFFVRFLFNVCFSRSNLRKLPANLCFQLHHIGSHSCLIMMVSALFIGVVVGLQGYHTLEKFGSTTQLGQLLALSISRELAPVISALLFAGRVGSSLTAEIGLMKTTEQLASMEMMGIEPLNRVIFPRLLAGMIALPILNLIFAAVAIYGGYLIGVQWFGIDSGIFWTNMQTSVQFSTDIFNGMIKSFVFALVIVWMALYQGYVSEATAEGISRATTKTVVYASLGVLFLDFVLTADMIGSW